MSDLLFTNLTERLDRIEKKIDNRLLKDWFSISDVIRTTGLSRSTINRGITLGELKSVKNGGKRMFKRDWIDKWITG